MNLVYTKICPSVSDTVYIESRNQRFCCIPFPSRPVLHAHPELELVFIQSGYGKRIIGNTVDDFDAGELVFIGKNVPHVWLSHADFYQNDPTLESRHIFVYFNASQFENLFEGIEEFRRIRMLIHKSVRGIKVTGETRRLITVKLEELLTLTGMEKMLCFLNILHHMSISEHIACID